jgi:hypothetical protein
MQLISQLVKLTRFGIYEDLWKREKLPKANFDMTQGYWVPGPTSVEMRATEVVVTCSEAQHFPRETDC